jgi:sulfur carrier protein ThiS adenylyltransferase
MVGSIVNKLLTDRQFVQYYRQLMLPQVQESGQYSLLQQHILIIGAGGLGTHVAQQLAAAGIGHIHIMDDDKIEASNLPRQVLFGPSDIGKLKVNQVKQRLNQQNTDINVQIYPIKFDASSWDILRNNSAFDEAFNHSQLLVLDCSDNMPTRQAVNQWCVDNRLTLVSAAISAYTGQLLLVDAGRIEQIGCYRCIFNEQYQAQGCESMGVLGPAVAIMASMQCMLALNYLLEKPDSPASPHLHLLDGLDLSWRKLIRKRDPACPVCQHR